MRAIQVNPFCEQHVSPYFGNIEEHTGSLKFLSLRAVPTHRLPADTYAYPFGLKNQGLVTFAWIRRRLATCPGLLFGRLCTEVPKFSLRLRVVCQALSRYQGHWAAAAYVTIRKLLTGLVDCEGCDSNYARVSGIVRARPWVDIL